MESRGTRLKKIRLEKGLTLEEVQKKTKIHLNILEAIEGDSLTNLSPIYLKGFFKIYCKFLEVDPKEYIEDYKEPSYKVSEKAKAVAKQVKPAENKLVFKVPSIKLPSFHLSKKVINTFIVAAAAIISLLILFNFGKLLINKIKSLPKKRVHSVTSPQQKETKKPLKSEKTKSVAAVTALKPLNPETVPQKEPISGIRLGIRSRENCWVSLKVDGKLVFQRVLEKGRFESWQAKNKIELSLGNAGVVELEVNGQLFSNLGRKGQALKNILITKEGLKIGR